MPPKNQTAARSSSPATSVQTMGLAAVLTMLVDALSRTLRRSLRLTDLPIRLSAPRHGSAATPPLRTACS